MEKIINYIKKIKITKADQARIKDALEKTDIETLEFLLTDSFEIFETELIYDVALSVRNKLLKRICKKFNLESGMALDGAEFIITPIESDIEDYITSSISDIVNSYIESLIFDILANKKVNAEIDGTVQREPLKNDIADILSYIKQNLLRMTCYNSIDDLFFYNYYIRNDIGADKEADLFYREVKQIFEALYYKSSYMTWELKEEKACIEAEYKKDYNIV